MRHVRTREFMVFKIQLSTFKLFHNQFADKLPRTYDFYAHSNLSYNQRGLLEKFTPLQKLLHTSAVCMLGKTNIPKGNRSKSKQNFSTNGFLHEPKTSSGIPKYIVNSDNQNTSM